MNHKILTYAIAAAMMGSMGFANAAVSVYGQTNVSIDATDVDGGGDDLNMESNTAAFGIKGKENISDNLQAVFKYELQTDISESPNGLVGRDQYLGLQGGYGRFLFGTTSTAYKSPGSKIDPWYRTSIQSRSIGLQSNLHSGKGEEGHGRGRNMIRYDSPKFGGGIGFTATYQLDNDQAAEDNDPYSVGLTYGSGGNYLFASYIDTQSEDDGAAAQIGGKYSLAGFTFRGIYELDKGLITDRRSNGGALSDGADLWSFGIDFKLASLLISLDYGESDSSDGDDGIAGNADDISEMNIWRLGFQYMMSKRTKAYLGHAQVDRSEDGALGLRGESDTTTFGFTHKF